MSRTSSFDSSPADSPVKRPCDPKKQQQPSQASKNGGQETDGKIQGSFFDSLSWAKEDDEEKEARDQEPTELKVGLMDDQSDDEDDFADFSQLKNNGSAAPQGYGLMSDDAVLPASQKQQNGKPKNAAGQGDDFFASQFDEHDKNSSSQPEVVDLLNMNFTTNPTQTVNEGVDLLNIGGDPSNVDLLSGHSLGKPSAPASNAGASGPEPDLLGMSGNDVGGDSFDPFQQFSASRTSAPSQQASSVSSLSSSTQPDLRASNQTTQNNDTFDPFQNFGSANQTSSSSTVKVTPPQQKSSSAAAGGGGGLDDDFFSFMEGSSSSTSKDKGNPEPDLMTGWNASNLQAFTSNQSPSHSATNNLKPATGGIHKSASTGSAMNFQAAMGGRNSPSMSSGMGMAGSGGMGNIGAVPKADPFADFGKWHFQTCPWSLSYRYSHTLKIKWVFVVVVFSFYKCSCTR